MANTIPKTNGNSQDSLVPHELCDPCKSFWERATSLHTQFDALPGADEELVELPQYLRFSPRPADVLSAASLGCHFCSIVVGAAHAVQRSFESIAFLVRGSLNLVTRPRLLRRNAYLPRSGLTYLKTGEPRLLRRLVKMVRDREVKAHSRLFCPFVAASTM